MAKPKLCTVCKVNPRTPQPLSKVCGYQCALELINQNKARDAKKQGRVLRKDLRQRRKEFKDNDLPKQKKLTQDVFNKLRKLQEFEWFKSRGLEPECISCGKTNMDWCCSHLKTVKSHGELRYDEMNTKLACNRYCNKGLSGNINGNKTTRGYLAGLKERFGEDEARRIIDYCNTNRVKKWTCEELIQMRANFNKQIRELEKVV